MAQEVFLNNYYSSVTRNNWLSTNLACSIGMEFWLSWLLFKRDISRTVYSKEDICFRRRVETLGRGDVKTTDINYVSLDLPFASYSQTGNFEEDDRVASMNAAAAVKGHLQPDTGILLKNMPVKVKFSATAFYSRREDVDVAAQLLYWEKNPINPIYFIVNHEIAGQPLDVPVFMTIDSIDSNVDYQEKQWLTQSKIFPIKIEVTVRTYQTLIETVDDGRTMLPLRWSGLYGYNRNHELYLTQNTILMWADEKFSKDQLEERLKHDPSYLERGVEEFETYVRTVSPNPEGLVFTDSMGNQGKAYHSLANDYMYETLAELKDEEDGLMVRLEMGEDVTKEIEDNKAAQQSIVDQRCDIDEVNGIVESAVKGYFYPDNSLQLKDYKAESVTDNSITVMWDFNDAEIQNFKDLVIYIPGIIHERIKDAFQRTFTIDGLHPGSDYPITMILRSLEGEKTFLLKARTSGDRALEQDLLHSLVGKRYLSTFTQR